jgi:outer membrane scaffolding protein for murein synthesis (MipA/OmpV family)
MQKKQPKSCCRRGVRSVPIGVTGWMVAWLPVIKALLASLARGAASVSRLTAPVLKSPLLRCSMTAIVPTQISASTQGSQQHRRLPAIDMGSGFRSIGLNYTYRNYINENWQIFGEVLYEHFGSDIKRSPIAREDFEAEVGIGFIYTF